MTPKGLWSDGVLLARTPQPGKPGGQVLGASPTPPALAQPEALSLGGIGMEGLLGFHLDMGLWRAFMAVTLL